MVSTFSGLEIALRALTSSQVALGVVSHNIANANTEGYSRQKAVLSATEPYTVPTQNRSEAAGQLGTGVTVSSIHRYSSDYLNSQLREEVTRANRWTVIESGYGQIETIFQEPSDTGISSALSDFWQAWSDLASLPDDLAARTAVVEAASTLAYSIRDGYDRLSELQSDMDLKVEESVSRINDIAKQLAGLNDTISKVLAFGDSPNDLLDTRDKLLTELSGIVNINYMQNEDGTITVSIGGHSLVMGDDYSQLKVKADSSNGMLAKVCWTDTGESLVVNGVSLEGGLTTATAERVGGTLGGALYVRDVLVPAMQDQLDTMATALIESTNALQAGGYGLQDDSTDPATARPGSGVSNVSVDAAGPVAGIVVDSSLYPAEQGLGAGSYSIETRDNGGVIEFRVVDTYGAAISVNDVGGSGSTDGWQEVSGVLGTTFDTGRGFAIEFNSTSGTADGLSASFQYDNFFSGTGAADIDVSRWVSSEPNRVATASTADATADGSVALSISQLRTALTVNGSYTVDAYYAAVITQLGLDSVQASNMVESTGAMVEYLQGSIDSLAAVDLDEEAVNLIQYQRAYQAAARVMTTMDEMLDRLINGTGRVGL